MDGKPLLDSEWVKHAFLLPPALRSGDFGRDVARAREATSAEFKFTDSSLGGNFAINNPPQFTRNADIRYPGMLNRREGEGMGRYYSEAIDDPKQVIHMSFGVPSYNSIAQFFTSFYDSRMAKLANTGRSSDVFYNIGLVGGFVVTLPLQPFIIGLTAVTKVYQFINKQRPSKWYYFKPNMHTYWSTVNTIANDLAIHMGIIPRVLSSDQDDAMLSSGRNDAEYDPMVFHNLLPELFRRDGGIDVMRLSTRSQRLAGRARTLGEELKRDSSNVAELRSNLIQYMQQHPRAIDAAEDDSLSARDYFYHAVKSQGYSDEATGSDSMEEWIDLGFDNLNEYLSSIAEAGNQFASFRVNYNGSVSESFSSSVRDSNVAQQVNSKVQDARNLRFSVMDGNIVEGLGDFLGGLADTAAGLLDSVKLGGLATLAGNAFIDVPKHWENSTANLPTASYTIPLHSPYGNPISRYINMMIPISMVLAGGLPLSAGRASYTSPFICQIYHQGRVQCQLGMIDSITLRRGTGNVGWNAEHQMLGAELEISVVDLSSIMHVPIKGAFGGEGNIIERGARAAVGTIAEGIDDTLGTDDVISGVGMALTDSAVWDENSAFSDYMAVLGGLSVDDTYYFQNRLNLNMTRSLRSFKTWKSPANIIAMTSDNTLGRMFMQFGQTTSRFDQEP